MPRQLPEPAEYNRCIPNQPEFAADTPHPANRLQDMGRENGTGCFSRQNSQSRNNQCLYIS